MPKFTKAESNYIRGIVEGLTLDRYKDNEIVKYLQEEHQMTIDDSAIRHIRRKMQKDAKPWFERLRNSDYAYLSTYKERIDSMLRYQMKLNKIINNSRTSTGDTIAAIRELHKIEMSLATLYKNIPNALTPVEDNTDNDFSSMEYQTSAITPEDIPTTF
jgi:hypothetical protein